MDTSISEYSKLDLMLKLTKSVEIGMIPGDGEAIEKKSFQWQVKFFSEKMMFIDVFFDNPDMVS